jgi:hypothetical protein
LFAAVKGHFVLAFSHARAQLGGLLKEETAMSGKKAFVLLAITVALRFLSTAPAAAGSDHDRGRESYVVPCSLDGVNPVYHPRIFRNPAFAEADYGFVEGRDHTLHVEPNCKKHAFIGPGAE